MLHLDQVTNGRTALVIENYDDECLLTQALQLSIMFSGVRRLIATYIAPRNTAKIMLTWR